MKPSVSNDQARFNLPSILFFLYVLHRGAKCGSVPIIRRGNFAAPIWLNDSKSRANAALEIISSGGVCYTTTTVQRSKSWKKDEAQTINAICIDLDPVERAIPLNAVAVMRCVKRICRKHNLPLPTFFTIGRGVWIVWAIVPCSATAENLAKYDRIRSVFANLLARDSKKLGFEIDRGAGKRSGLIKLPGSPNEKEGLCKIIQRLVVCNPDFKNLLSVEQWFQQTKDFAVSAPLVNRKHSQNSVPTVSRVPKRIYLRNTKRKSTDPDRIEIAKQNSALGIVGDPLWAVRKVIAEILISMKAKRGVGCRNSFLLAIGIIAYCTNRRKVDCREEFKEIVRAYVQRANLACCDPPLLQNEVEDMLRSLFNGQIGRNNSELPKDFLSVEFSYCCAMSKPLSVMLSTTNDFMYGSLRITLDEAEQILKANPFKSKQGQNNFILWNLSEHRDAAPRLARFASKGLQFKLIGDALLLAIKNGESDVQISEIIQHRFGIAISRRTLTRRRSGIAA